jgi:hypothetical protein
VPLPHRPVNWLVIALMLITSACGSPTHPASAAVQPRKAVPTSAPDALAPTDTATLSSVQSSYSKVLVIAEENKPYGDVIGAADAPYVNKLADTYGLATAMDAGYSVDCPSLPAYLILTSGEDHGICDDRNPKAHGRLYADQQY